MTTFSTALKFELPGDGQQSGTWGQTTNKNFGTLVEQAVTGVQSIVMVDSNYTLTSLNGVSDEARNAVLVLSGTNAAIRNVIIPSTNKTYTVTNNTVGGFAVTVKTASGTGYSVPNGGTVPLYCNGTEVYLGQNVADTQAYTDNSQKIATTAFVRSIIPTGLIMMWSGSAASIPSGWLLCNGSSGTPDLRDRFIIGAGNAFNPGDTGGSTTISGSNLPTHTHTFSGTTGNENTGHYHPVSGYTGGQTADHSHLIPAWGYSGGGALPVQGGTPYSAIIATAGTSNDHAHYFAANSGDISNLHQHNYSGTTASAGSSSAYYQPYYSLCFIMKV